MSHHGAQTAQRFAGNAQVGGNHRLGNPLQQTGIQRDQVVIPIGGVTADKT